MQIKKIPFYSNTEDRTHCYQACLKMALKYFSPERDFSFKELDKISQKEEGKWTWPMAALVWLADNDFEVLYKETFDYEDFSKRGKDYLVDRYSEEVANETEKNGDIKQGQELSKVFTEKVNIKQEIPGEQDIFDFIKKDFIVIVLLNARTLNNKSGYAGHFVLVKGWDENNFIINDPSFPGEENRKVFKGKFMEAWSYAGENNRNLIAIRKTL